MLFYQNRTLGNPFLVLNSEVGSNNGNLNNHNLNNPNLRAILRAPGGGSNMKTFSFRLFSLSKSALDPSTMWPQSIVALQFNSTPVTVI